MDASPSPATPPAAGGGFPPFDLTGLKTYELKSRPSKVFYEDLGWPVGADASVGDWLDSLPRQLAGKDLRRVRDHLCRCYDEQRRRSAYRLAPR